MNMLRVYTLVGLFLGPAASWAAGSPSEAEHLYEANCISCHDSRVYTRPDHRINDLGALKTQVRRCELNLGLRWFDDQIDAVAGLLNHRYYKFPE